MKDEKETVGISKTLFSFMLQFSFSIECTPSNISAVPVVVILRQLYMSKLVLLTIYKLGEV